MMTDDPVKEVRCRLCHKGIGHYDNSVSYDGGRAHLSCEHAQPRIPPDDPKFFMTMGIEPFEAPTDLAPYKADG